ncbi:MAG: hypothetical protein ACXVUL_15390 [Solirubrobacteraceae bacterium]
MSPVSHQTIKLSPGKHYSPDDGACVMELASMLAGEPFNDHPATVCPVLGSLLRSYNDSVDDDARQDLYAYAARVVGTRADADVERRRSECVAAWTYERRFRRMRRFLPEFAARRLCQLKTLSLESIGTQAVRQIPRHTDETHQAMLWLIDDLLSISPRRRAPLPRTERPEVSVSPR